MHSLHFYLAAILITRKGRHPSFIQMMWYFSCPTAVPVVAVVALSSERQIGTVRSVVTILTIKIHRNNLEEAFCLVSCPEHAQIVCIT